jgi:hypothetical protein
MGFIVSRLPHIRRDRFLLVVFFDAYLLLRQRAYSRYSIPTKWYFITNLLYTSSSTITPGELPSFSITSACGLRLGSCKVMSAALRESSLVL